MKENRSGPATVSANCYCFRDWGFLVHRRLSIVKSSGAGGLLLASETPALFIKVIMPCADSSGAESECAAR
ncbi:MAG: hypothetical protein JJT95_17255 [Pararhodobacter sp.]|nr:hypothetical protein [Pararhodobacter sp.]